MRLHSPRSRPRHRFRRPITHAPDENRQQGFPVLPHRPGPLPGTRRVFCRRGPLCGSGRCVTSRTSGRVRDFRSRDRRGGGASGDERDGVHGLLVHEGRDVVRRMDPAPGATDSSWRQRGRPHSGLRDERERAVTSSIVSRTSWGSQAPHADECGSGPGVWDRVVRSEVWRIRDPNLIDPMTGRAADRGLGVVVSGDENRVWRGASRSPVHLGPSGHGGRRTGRLCRSRDRGVARVPHQWGIPQRDTPRETGSSCPRSRRAASPPQADGPLPNFSRAGPCQVTVPGPAIGCDVDCCELAALSVSRRSRAEWSRRETPKTRCRQGSRRGVGSPARRQRIGARRDRSCGRASDR